MSRTKSFLYALSYYPVYFSLVVFTWMPMQVQYLVSDLFFFFAYYIVGYRRKVVKSNLLNSFPEKSEKERRKIERKFYRHLGDYFIESIALYGLSIKELNKRFRYENLDLINELYDRGKGIVLAMGHYSNWEWYSGMQLQMKHRLLGLYKPLNNPYFNRLIIKLREKYGGHTIPISSSIKGMMEYHKKNILTITVFLTDQRPMVKYIEYWTTFLNQETPVQLGTEKISKKLDYAVVYGQTRKLKRGHYLTRFTLLTENPRETAEFEITEMHTRALEKTIREQPEYWLWSHRRWKHDRKKIEMMKAEQESAKELKGKLQHD